MENQKNADRDPVIDLLRSGLKRSNGNIGGRLRLALDEVAADVPPSRTSANAPYTVTQKSYVDSPPSVVRHTDNFRFRVLGRNAAGGAGVGAAYQHWLGGSGDEHDVEFSDANISGVADVIENSARGETESRSFQIAIERAAKSGAPIAVSTFAPIDTRGAVIGRARGNISGWVEAAGGRWKFEGYLTGEDEYFDFNDDLDRGRIRNRVATAVGEVGDAAGAADYKARYTGSVVIRASGDYGF